MPIARSDVEVQWLHARAESRWQQWYRRHRESRAGSQLLKQSRETLEERYPTFDCQVPISGSYLELELHPWLDDLHIILAVMVLETHSKTLDRVKGTGCNVAERTPMIRDEVSRAQLSKEG